MIKTFDRQMPIHRWIGYSKLHSLIIPYGLSHPVVNMLYDRGKTFNLLGLALPKILFLPVYYFGHSSNERACMLTRFQGYFRSEMIVSDALKALCECKRLLKEIQTWVYPVNPSALIKLVCPTFLTSGKINKRSLLDQDLFELCI